MTSSSALTVPRLCDMVFKGRIGVGDMEYRDDQSLAGGELVVIQWHDEPGLYSIYIVDRRRGSVGRTLTKWRGVDPFTAQAILYHLFNGEPSHGTSATEVEERYPEGNAADRLDADGEAGAGRAHAQAA